MKKNGYEIIRLIGKGRTGGVYESRHRQTQQQIALRRFFSTTQERDAEDWLDDFEAFAKQIAQIKHPAMLEILDAGLDEDGAFMATEWLEKGKNIEQCIQERKHLSNENFYVMANNILDAFALLHHKGFCHGAVHAGSIVEVELNEPKGHIYKCVDLGLAALIPVINPSLARGIEDTALAAPELFEGESADARSDVYMLGQLFYFSLAGGHPFAGLPEKEAYEKHKKHKMAPLSGYRTSVPKDLVDWIEKMTQANPEDRPQNAGEALKIMPYHDFSQQEVLLLQTSKQKLKASSASQQTQPFGSTGNYAQAAHDANPYVQSPLQIQEKKHTGLIIASIIAMLVLIGITISVVLQEDKVGNKLDKKEGNYEKQKILEESKEQPSWLATPEEIKAEKEAEEKKKQSSEKKKNNANKLAKTESSSQAKANTGKQKEGLKQIDPKKIKQPVPKNATDPSTNANTANTTPAKAIEKKAHKETAKNTSISKDVKISIDENGVRSLILE